MPYPDAFLDHVRSPRGVGALEAPTHRGADVDGACGDRMELDLDVRDGTIRQVRYRVVGCPGAIACGSALATLLEDRPARADAVSRDEIDALLGGVPRAKRHAISLALRTLRAALGRPA